MSVDILNDQFQSVTSSENNSELKMFPVHKSDNPGRSPLIFKITKIPNRPLVENLILPNFSECFDSYRKRLFSMSRSANTQPLTSVDDSQLIHASGSGHNEEYSSQEDSIINDKHLQRMCSPVTDNIEGIALKDEENDVKYETDVLNNEKITIEREKNSIKTEVEEIKEKTTPRRDEERRRSSRLIALQGKPKVIIDTTPVCITRKRKPRILNSSNNSNLDDSVSKRIRRSYLSSSQTNGSEKVDRNYTRKVILDKEYVPPCTRSQRKLTSSLTVICTVSPNGALINAFPTVSDVKPQIFYPSSMKLKHMLLKPGAKPLCLSSFNFESSVNAVLPKFSNVDTSKVFSCLKQQETNTTTNKSHKTKISLFFTKRNNKTHDTPKINNFVPCKENMLHKYNWKKIRPGVTSLAKKHQILDLVTLDNCYGNFFAFRRIFEMK